MKWVVGIVVLVGIAAMMMSIMEERDRVTVARANVRTAVNDLAATRDQVTAEFVRTKAMPSPREFPSASGRVRNIRLESGGRLVATLSFPNSAEIDGKQLALEASIAGATLEWRCEMPGVEKKQFLPGDCR
jgi:hypothetical protein